MAYTNLSDLFKGICDAIRAKKGTSGIIEHQNIPNEIASISVGVGVDVSGVTAKAEDVLSPKVFIDANGVTQTGTIATKTSSDISSSGATVTIPAGYYGSQTSKTITSGALSVPNISVSSGGVITATGGVSSSGYISSGATKSGTYAMLTQAGKTITPSTSTQTAVQSGTYTTGTVYVKGDSNLVPENIRSGSSIFSVVGSLTEGQYTYVDCISDTGVLTIKNFGREDGIKPSKLMIFSNDQSNINITSAFLFLDGDSITAMWYSPTYGYTVTPSNSNLISCYVNLADDALCMDILASGSQSSFGNGRYHVIAFWE